MNRRQLLKLVALGGAGSILDIDRLLWVPNTKSFFFPSRNILTISQIVEIEYLRIVPHIKTLFERDDTFYRILNSDTRIVSDRIIRVPLIIKPGFYKE